MHAFMDPLEPAPPPPRCDLVCFSYLRWDATYQRPQHLLSRAARDRRVFFVEDPIFADGPPHVSMRRTVEGVLVVTPTVPLDTPPARVPALLRKLVDHVIVHQRLERYALWFYSPLALAFAHHLDPVAIVYDCIDDLAGLGGAPDELAAFEELLLVATDVVFTAGPSLHALHHDRHANVHMFPSAADVRHFLQARRLTTRERPPVDQGAIPVPRVGYFGTIDHRVDLALVSDLAALRPDVHLAMLGPIGRIPAASLPRRPNLHWLGPKTYDELPYYLAGWAAAMLPFVRDPSTRFLSPSRTPELLAAGRAVIATSIPDLVHPFRELGLIRIADTAAGFSVAIDAVRAEPARDRNRRADRWLAHVSWDRTWAAMDTLLEAAIARRGDPGERARALRSLRMPACSSPVRRSAARVVPPVRRAAWPRRPALPRRPSRPCPWARVPP